jgi:hypothetical protein
MNHRLLHVWPVSKFIANNSKMMWRLKCYNPPVMSARSNSWQIFLHGIRNTRFTALPWQYSTSTVGYASESNTKTQQCKKSNFNHTTQLSRWDSHKPRWLTLAIIVNPNNNQDSSNAVKDWPYSNPVTNWFQLHWFAKTQFKKICNILWVKCHNCTHP